jgi:PPOX class probable F420-dependent enzyme
MLDKSHPKWRDAEARLNREVIVWLTTVQGHGQPQSSPVWFRWDGEAFMVYSMPRAGKVANIRDHPQVSVHLNDDGTGGDIVTMDATAQITADPVGEHDSAYVDKYRKRIADLGYDPERFAREYSVALRIVPSRARLW